MVFIALHVAEQSCSITHRPLSSVEQPFVSSRLELVIWDSWIFASISSFLTVKGSASITGSLIVHAQVEKRYQQSHVCPCWHGLFLPALSEDLFLPSSRSHVLDCRSYVGVPCRQPCDHWSELWMVSHPPRAPRAQPFSALELQIIHYWCWR